MEILFYLASLFLLLFLLLAVYDGVYLHLWKFELFKKKESLFEHKTHTYRAILFPLIVGFYFLMSQQIYYFSIGLCLIIIDLIILGIDAYSEKDSRAFMGGLPRWEYIIHLFTNSFHFAAICLITATKFSIVNNAILFNMELIPSDGKQIFEIICVNILPGAIILAFIHVLLMTPFGINCWNYFSKKSTSN